MRKYEQTHRWLEFKLDLRQAPTSLWLGLGEAQSKCEHIANTPLQPAIAEQLHSLYLAKGIRATTAIEGNTLTEEQVLRRIEKKLELPASQDYLGKEIDNILEACNKIKDDVFSGKAITPTPEQICGYNKTVLNGLSIEEEVVPGQIRTSTVGVGHYRAVPAEDCEYLLEKLCTWLASDFNIIPDYELATSLLKAIVAHLYFELIHPFGDGNGRTGRLIEYQILLSGGAPTAAAHLLSNHYNLTRQEYYRQLDRVSKSEGDIMPFVEYAVRGFVDGLREQLNWIRLQLFDVTWINFIHEIFHDKTSKADKRRRDLVLSLGIQPVPVGMIAEQSPKMAAAYSSKTRKTLIRDIGVLKKMRLVEDNEKGVRAKRELVFAFVPRKINSTKTI